MSALAFNSNKVQELRRLLGRRSSRYDERRFVVEGPVLVAEAVAAGWTCEEQFVPEGSDSRRRRRRRRVRTRRRGARAGGVDRDAAGTAGDRRDARRPNARRCWRRSSFVVVLDRVGDPGNLGTILRSAEAAGADLVVLTPGSVDPFNPKVVRASAGALFHVPVVTATIDDVASAGFELFGTTSHGFPGRTVVPYTDADLTGRIAVVMGNEAAGLPDEWNDTVGPVRSWITIPHCGRSESLNVAMAATVIVFEAARQRTGQ